MNALIVTPLLLLATQFGAHEAPEPCALGHEVAATVAGDLPATGTFTQTGITSLRTSTSGPVTVLEQTSFGVVTGTIDGTFDDVLKVVILPNGSFVTEFTLTLDCSVQGQQGVLTLRAVDIGQLVGPTTGQFAGVAVVSGASGDLEGMTGMLRIAGTVDLTTGLSTYGYMGALSGGS